MDSWRGTGRTTKQMQEAPQKAIFVWPSYSSVGYAKQLAHKLGRPDLEIVTPDWLESDKWRGRELSGIVIDHAAHLTGAQYDRLARVIERVRPP